MSLETAALFALPVLFIVLLALERRFPARPLPKVAGWKRKGLLFLLVTGGLSAYAPLLWMAPLGHLRLLDLAGLGIAAGAAVAFAGTQLAVYGWHRLMHSVDPLWRWFHQMHHSAERLDIYGANYFHPLDVLGFAVVQTVVPYLVLGVRAEAALLAGIVGTFYTLFQHTNVRTPQWLGYLIQRPESHSVHHARGVHGYNYADFPLWDIVFGTFRNPRPFEPEAGFWDGASARVGKLLAGRDVAQPS